MTCVGAFRKTLLISTFIAPTDEGLGVQCMPGDAVVFVHGLWSSATTWKPFLGLLAQEAAVIPTFKVDAPQYDSPKANLNPLHAIPDVDLLADRLATRIDLRLADVARIMLVGHSQGGLIIQRMLMKLAHEQDRKTLPRVRQVSLFACPNSGSDLLASVRRRLNLGDQIRALAPYDRLLGETHRAVQRHFLVSDNDAPPTYSHVAFSVYVGESDGVVPVESARGSFLHTQVLTGDHSSIIVPDSSDDDRFRALIRDVRQAFPVQPDLHPSAPDGPDAGQRAQVLPFRRSAPTDAGAMQRLLEALNQWDISFRTEWLALRQPSMARDLLAAMDRLQDPSARELLMRMNAKLEDAVSARRTARQRTDSAAELEALRRQFLHNFDREN